MDDVPIIFLFVFFVWFLIYGVDWEATKIHQELSKPPAPVAWNLVSFWK